MRSAGFVLCFILAMAAFIQAIDSQVSFRIYRKTLQEIIDKNAPLVSDYLVADLGTVDVGDLTIENAKLHVYTEEAEFESQVKFLANQGLSLKINDLLFQLTGTSDGKEATLKGDVESLALTLSVKNSGKEKDPNARFDANTLPEFSILDHSANINGDSFVWTIGGEERKDDALNAATSAWINAAIQTNMAVIKVLANSAQTYIADYLSNTIDPETFQGKISFSEIEFHDEYAELGVISSFDSDEEGTPSKALPEVTGDENPAVQILFDENIINAGLHSSFHEDGEFTLRDVLQIDDPTNEYADMFKAILMTQVVGQAWAEIESEYGSEKK